MGLLTPVRATASAEANLLTTRGRWPSRIVHYYPRALGRSGVTVALWGWARAAAQAGIEVAVLHSGGERRYGEFDLLGMVGPEVHDLEIPHRGSRRMITHPVGFEKFLRRDDLLVLHEGWVPSNHVAASAARRAQIPYVVMPHGVYERAWRNYLKPPVRLRERFERGLLDEALAVHVFFSSEIADVLAIGPRAEFITLPTGHDVPPESWTGGGGYLAWIGRYDPVNKGLDLLVNAVGSLKPEERPAIRLHGYDFNGGRAMLEHLIADQGLEPWVKVLDVIAGPQKLAFLREADGYVHPSRWESQGMAIMENLALGVPCLVTDSTEIAPTLRDARAAIVRAPTVESLADGLRRIRLEGAAVGEKGRTLIAERFRWETLMSEYLLAIRELRQNRVRDSGSDQT